MVQANASDANASEYDILIDLIRSRASVRKLKPDPIPDEKIAQILEAGRWAMSGANGQPWDFIVVKDPEQVLQYLYQLREKTVPVYRHSYTGTKDEPAKS